MAKQMKIYEFTMQDSFNLTIDTLIKYAEDAAERQLEFIYDEDTAFIRIDKVEHEGLPVQNGEYVSYQFVVYGEIITKLEERLDDLEKDCKELLERYDQPLANMVIGEDIPELIKLARRVSNAFKKPLPEGTGDQYQGYVDAVNALRREIYE